MRRGRFTRNNFYTYSSQTLTLSRGLVCKRSDLELFGGPGHDHPGHHAHRHIRLSISNYVEFLQKRLLLEPLPTEALYSKLTGDTTLFRACIFTSAEQEMVCF